MTSARPHVVTASARINAPAERVYGIIADYRNGHPKILPKQFTGLVIEEGGRGAGTVIRFHFRAFGRSEAIRALISEPDPGRVLVESVLQPRRTTTTFTVTPVETGREADVVIATEFPNRAGLLGKLERWMTTRMLLPVYAEELRRLAHQAAVTPDTFPSDPAGLPPAVPSEIIETTDGDVVSLRIAPVAKQIGRETVRMLAYNGSIPGPTFKVQEGKRLQVSVANDGDLDTTVHWHGIRVDNRFDGTHHTQAAITTGEAFAYVVKCPDPGLYWYHPHVREDYGQEMGLYGNVLVVPNDPDYWPPVNREVVLTLDDILLEDGRVAPFRRDQPTHCAMGRFGDVLLIGGQSDLSLTAEHGEVVRFYLTNTANTRVFNVGLSGARMKLVGGDSGRYEHETFVEVVVLAPSERAVVDVLFTRAGHATLQHHSPDRCYRLADILVLDGRPSPSLQEQYEVLRTNSDLAGERIRVASHLAALPDKTLAFVAEMDMDDLAGPGAAPYTCPMHPDVVRDTTGRCPDCGMKLLPSSLVQKATTHEHSGGSHGASDGIEWEDDMVDINRMTTPATMRWKLVDRTTGAENHAIDWTFKAGDQVKIRLVNEMDSDHPMHHPFHIHGAGRFLILSRDGVVEQNLVWKDTVLVRTGQTVDILLDVTNPGVWMAHCHIAEHHESGMMFNFRVEDR